MRLPATEKFFDDDIKTYYEVLCMGRIKPKFVKINAKRLIEAHPDKFNDDFDHNKQVIKEMNLIGSKKIVNQLAGYITRLMKRKEF